MARKRSAKLARGDLEAANFARVVTTAKHPAIRGKLRPCRHFKDVRCSWHWNERPKPARCEWVQECNLTVKSLCRPASLGRNTRFQAVRQQEMAIGRKVHLASASIAFGHPADALACGKVPH